MEECGAVNAESLQAVINKSAKQKVQAITISSNVRLDYVDILPDTKEVERLFLEFLQTYRCSLNET